MFQGGWKLLFQHRIQMKKLLGSEQLMFKSKRRALIKFLS